MSLSDLYYDFGCHIYKPHLSSIRDSGAITDLSNPLCVAMLILDFDTEVAMNGIANFIGNSTGRYIPETIKALSIIGCIKESSILVSIQSLAQSAGMNYASIQNDRSEKNVHEITSFSKDHGAKWDAVFDEINKLSDAIDFSNIQDKANQFVIKHETTFKNAIAAAQRT